MSEFSKIYVLNKKCEKKCENSVKITIYDYNDINDNDYQMLKDRLTSEGDFKKE